ncbi:MAG: hypothetical protein IT292_01400 [Deltaproteobacteria bacterium]|nr:hypothetical protein [Deltaproteobacteria bacterium]
MKEKFLRGLTVFFYSNILCKEEYGMNPSTWPYENVVMHKEPNSGNYILEASLGYWRAQGSAVYCKATGNLDIHLRLQ